jgi:hypothetical protein
VKPGDLLFASQHTFYPPWGDNNAMIKGDLVIFLTDGIIESSRHFFTANKRKKHAADYVTILHRGLPAVVSRMWLRSA